VAAGSAEELLGVSRTVFVMTRERDLPGGLAAVDLVRQVPRRAELAVGVAVIVLLLAATLPAVSVLSGLAVFALGFIVWLVRRRSR
jgi:basic amino acid/polyamine antiporter, APA family